MFTIENRKTNLYTLSNKKLHRYWTTEFTLLNKNSHHEAADLHFAIASL